MAYKVHGRAYEDLMPPDGQHGSHERMWRITAIVAAVVAAVALAVVGFLATHRTAANANACVKALDAADTWHNTMQQRITLLQQQLDATHTLDDLNSLGGRLAAASANLPNQAQIWSQEQSLSAECRG